jgi:hypothetical protein
MSKSNEITCKEPTPEETVEWWQWASSIQEQNDKNQKHPFLIGGETNQNQNRIFVCLTGIGRKGGRDNNRRISISSDKDIFIPVFVASYSSAELPERSSDELMQQAVKDTEQPERLELSIDSKRLQSHFVKAGPFDLHQPNICIINPSKIKPGKYPTMSAGYWCKVSLPKRNEPYEVKFGGTNGIDFGAGPLKFDTDVTYTVTVS